MWIHILIFMVILGVFLAGKMGRLPPEAGNPEEKKLFIRIALTGNIIGMLLTFQSGGDKVYSSGYRMEKVSGIFSSSGGIPLMVQEHFSEIRQL